MTQLLTGRRRQTRRQTHGGYVHLCACSRGLLPACEWLRVAVRMGWFQPAAAPAWRRQKKDACWPKWNATAMSLRRNGEAAGEGS